MSNIISSPNFEDTEVLYGIYLQKEENKEASIDDFYDFLKKESADRQIFLKEYCTYSFKEVENTTVLLIELKKND